MLVTVTQQTTGTNTTDMFILKLRILRLTETFTIIQPLSNRASLPTLNAGWILHVPLQCIAGILIREIIFDEVSYIFLPVS